MSVPSHIKIKNFILKFTKICKVLLYYLIIVLILVIIILFIASKLNKTIFKKTRFFFKIRQRIPLKNISVKNVPKEGIIFHSVEHMNKGKDSIFFHETSINGNLTIRQACCVESCARKNKKYQINVLFSSHNHMNVSKTLKILNKFKNVKFYKLNITNYIKGTPMENFNLSRLSSSRWPMRVTSDALRYLTLYKFGGVYLDLDVMVVKRFNSLGRNWAGRELDLIGSSVLAFGKDKLGRYVAERAVMDFARNFNPRLFTNNGPMVIYRVLYELCSRNYTKSIILEKVDKCQGFRIYEQNVFSLLYHTQAFIYYKRNMFRYESKKVHGYHMFNFETQDMKIEENSFYSNLARRYCPDVYETFIEEFSN